MDAAQFDTLARSVIYPQGRRRFALLLGSLAAVPFLGTEEVVGKKKKKKKPVCLSGETIKASGKKRKKLIKNGATPGPCVPSVCSQGVCQPCTVTCSGSAVLCGAALSQALQAGGTIVVCPGRYAGGFTVAKDTVLVGAGAGDDPASSTILDGQGIDRVLLVENAKLSLAGVSVVNGAAGTENGGGVLGKYQNETRVADCAFVNNQGRYGGAMTAGGTLRITNSRFTGNTAFQGGGLYFGGTTCLISATDFTNNNVTDDGGAIYRSTGDVTLSSTTFTNNQPGNCAGTFPFAC